MNIKHVILLLTLCVVIGGCTSTDQVIQDRFEAGSLEQQAEEERRFGNEGAAILLEERAEHNRNTISLPLIIFEEVFK